jgi:hypothetical protein
MRLLESDLGTGKFAPANDLSSGRKVLNGSDDLALRAVIAPSCDGAIPSRFFAPTLSDLSLPSMVFSLVRMRKNDEKSCNR